MQKPKATDYSKLETDFSAQTALQNHCLKKSLSESMHHKIFCIYILI